MPETDSSPTSSQTNANSSSMKLFLDLLLMAVSAFYVMWAQRYKHGGAAFPSLIGFGVFFLATSTLIRDIITLKKSWRSQSSTRPPMKESLFDRTSHFKLIRIAGVLASVVLYILLLQIVGFYLAIIVAVTTSTAALSWRYRYICISIIVAILIAALFAYLFSFQSGISIPKGVL